VDWMWATAWVMTRRSLRRRCPRRVAFFCAILRTPETLHD
jgi:hypothetical protein